MLYDVVIIGGSFAGLSAAMQLVRAQRKVLVIDANKPRNRYAEKSHGIFALDGKSPTEIRDTVLSQLNVYPTFEMHQGSANRIEKVSSVFDIYLDDHPKVSAKRIVLATGLKDTLPDIPGVKEHWGRTVIHCPYCHGYELRNRELGVLAVNEMSFHQAAMIPDWGTTTLFTQGKHEPDPDTLNLLVRRGVSIERTPVISVEGDGTQINHVILKDERVVKLGGLYVGPLVSAASSIVSDLELERLETPMGSVVKVDDFKESSIKGVYVAGDLSNPMQNGTLAIYSGTMAGISAHQSLVFK